MVNANAVNSAIRKQFFTLLSEVGVSVVLVLFASRAGIGTGNVKLHSATNYGLKLSVRNG